MKNAFYFIFKVLIALKFFFFIVLVMEENGLIIKLRLVSEFMASSNGELIIAIHVFPDISRSSGIQTKKFG